MGTHPCPASLHFLSKFTFPLSETTDCSLFRYTTRPYASHLLTSSPPSLKMQALARQKSPHLLSTKSRCGICHLCVCPLFSRSYRRPKLSGFLGVDCRPCLPSFSCIIDSFLSTGSSPSTHRHAPVSLFRKIPSLGPQTLSCCLILRCPFPKEFSSSPSTLFTLLQSGFRPHCSPDTAPVTSSMTSTCSNPEVAFLSSLTLTQSFSKTPLLATSQLIQTLFA